MALNPNITVSTDVDNMMQAGNKAAIRSAIGAAPSDSPTFTGSSNFNGGVDFNSTVLADNGLGVTGDITVSGGKIITGEIQCEGTTSGTAQPIKYDSNEHRFRDYDGSPTDLMVIEKIDGYTGGRVGINKDPSASNAVALHIVAGKNSSTNVKDLGLKVVGGAFFNEFIRVGHYESSDSSGNDTRPTTPSNGTIIYDSSTHSFQGYVGGGAGWKTFTMS